MSKGFNRISYKKLDVSKIMLPNLLKENGMKKSSDGKPPKTYIGFCKYGDSEESARNLIVQLPPIRLDWGGIPGPNDQIFENDLDKAKNVKIPLSVNPEFQGETDEDRAVRQANIDKLRKLFVEKIDELMESDSGRKQLFGSVKEAKKKKFLYSKLLKTTIKKDDEDEEVSDDSGGEESGADSEPEQTDDTKPARYKSDFFFKCRVPWEWDDETKKYNLNKVKTTVVIVNNEKKNKEDFKKDGKYSHMDVTNLESLRSYMSYGSTVRLQLQLSNAFGCKETSPMVGNKRSYGLRWKINRILIDRDEHIRAVEYQKSKGGGNEQIDVPSDDESDEDMADNLLAPSEKTSNDEGGDNGSNSGDDESLEVADEPTEEKPVRRRAARKRNTKAD